MSGALYFGLFPLFEPEMPTIGDFSFANPGFLALLVVLLPALWIFWRARRREGIVLRDEADYRRAFGSGRLLKSALAAGLLVSIFSLVAIAAGPRVSEHRTETSREGIDIAIVLDLSKSMLAEDMTPNRIGAAKDVIRDFLSRLDGDRVGMVLFAGKPFVSVPLSFDYAGIAAMTDRITTDSIDQNAGPGLQGTAMGDGMLAAIGMLEKAREDAVSAGTTARERVMIVMTDGEANVGLDPKVAAKLAKDKGIRVHTVGIGKEWTPLVMTDAYGARHPFLDQGGNPLIATLDRDTLENVAGVTDGHAFYASDADSLDRVFATLADLERRSAKTENAVSERSFVWPFVAVLAISSLAALAALALLARSSPIRMAERTYSVLRTPRTVRIVAGSASAVVIVAMASPWTWGLGGHSADGSPVLWIVDVSRSMDSVDAGPDGRQSRLDRAKELVSQAMEARRGSEQGLAIFAGDSVLASPLTQDTDTLLTYVAGLDTSAVSRGGTDLAGAVGLASGRSVDGRSAVAVVLTDGGDPEDSDPTTLARTLARSPATLFVGLGSREGAPVPIGHDPFGNTVYADYRGQRVVSKLNADLLSSLGKAGAGYEENPDETTPPRSPDAVSYTRSADWNEERVLLAWCLLPLWLATIFIPDTRRYA